MNKNKWSSIHVSVYVPNGPLNNSFDRNSTFIATSIQI